MCLGHRLPLQRFRPVGEAKKVVPCACENDMDSSLTQLFLSLLSGGKSSGFGDFRDVEGDILAIVNCGQHPPCFFGLEGDAAEEKLSHTEFIGQEVFYHAGGAAVRGRTGGGQVMTIARMARENLRYYLVGTVLNTIDVGPEEHERYNVSWPIIRGMVPISGEELIRLWPCNHLGFRLRRLHPAPGGTGRQAGDRLPRLRPQRHPARGCCLMGSAVRSIRIGTGIRPGKSLDGYQAWTFGNIQALTRRGISISRR